jgi:hypothetical protein
MEAVFGAATSIWETGNDPFPGHTDDQPESRCTMSEPDIQRRLLLGSAVAALALRPSHTKADTSFTNFSFAATGAPAKRTMPERLSDIVNVKDWGAAGLGADYTSQIQAAINFAIGPRPDGTTGGTVFFPPGHYASHNLIVGSDSVNTGVIITGSGLSTLIIGLDRSGAQFSAGRKTYDCLEQLSHMSIQPGQTTAIFTRPNITMTGVNCGGSPGIDVSSGNGARISDCSLAYDAGRNAAYNNPHLNNPGTVAIALGSLATVRNVRIQGGYDVGFAVSGNCASLLGCAAEDNNTAVRVGWGPIGGGVFGEVPAVGCTIINVQTERTNTQFDLYNATGCFIGGHVTAQYAGTPFPEGGITKMVWAPGSPPVVTVTTARPHGMANGTYRLQIDSPNPGGFAVPNLPAGWILATVTSGPTGTSFTYQSPGSTDPGAFRSAVGWNWPMQYALRCRIVNQCTIVGSGFSANNSVATVDLDYSGDSAANHQNNVIIGLNGIQGWIPPRAKNRAGWKFIECNGAINPFDAVYGAGSAGFPATIAAPYGIMNYADLPGGASGSVQLGPFEGQEYDIIDSTNAASGNFGNTTSGGSNNHVKVRYSGQAPAAWRISG